MEIGLGPGHRWGMATQVSATTVTGAEDTIAPTWTAMPGNFSVFGGVVISDAGGPIAISMQGAPTSTGGTVMLSGRASGEIDLLIIDR